LYVGIDTLKRWLKLLMPLRLLTVVSMEKAMFLKEGYGYKGRCVFFVVTARLIILVDGSMSWYWLKGTMS
jgi:hypothetical protein